MKGLRLYKIEKLRGKTAIDALFSRSADRRPSGSVCYPLRAVWQENSHRSARCPQFLVMVPKRRLRHAVDRVRMRRRIRESYRLNRELLNPADEPRPVDIAFVYVADRLTPYADVDRAMRRLLQRINHSLATDETSTASAPSGDSPD